MPLNYFDFEQHDTHTDIQHRWLKAMTCRNFVYIISESPNQGNRVSLKLKIPDITCKHGVVTKRQTLRIHTCTIWYDVNLVHVIPYYAKLLKVKLQIVWKNIKFKLSLCCDTDKCVHLVSSKSSNRCKFIPKPNRLQNVKFQETQPSTYKNIKNKQTNSKKRFTILHYNK